MVDTLINSEKLGLTDPSEEVVVLNLHILAKLSAKACLIVLTKLDLLVGNGGIFEKLLVANQKLLASATS